MLKTMRRIVQEVNNALTMNEALQIVAERVREVMETQASSVFLIQPKTNELILRATDGLNADKVNKVRLHPGEGVVGLVVSRGEPINLDDAQKHANYYNVIGAGEDRFRAFLGVPITHKRRCLGVLFVQQEEPGRFDEAEEAFLATVATQLGATITDLGSRGVDFDYLTQEKQPAQFIEGIASARGVAIGRAMVVYPRANLESVLEKPCDDMSIEIDRFNQAVIAARSDIKTLSERLAEKLPPEEQALFDVYLGILDKESLGKEVVEIIKKLNCWAEFALKRVVDNHIVQFEAMDDNYLRERATDIKDLGERVLSHLQENTIEAVNYPKQTILVGHDVPASALAEVPPEKLAGVVSMTGSANSHVAILARAMGLPTIMGLTELRLSQVQDKKLIVDGYSGCLYIAPRPALLKEYAVLAEEEQELDRGLQKIKDLPAESLDGYQINLCVNVGLAVDVEKSLNVGADGIGLYRTEIPFMIRESFPSEETQRIIYRQLLGVFAPRPVTMRTLDVGGDKALPYFPISEKNPFLGWRGLRLTLDHPEIFLVQARAMLRASRGYNNLRIMFPMVTTLGEVDEALRLLRQAYSEVLEEGEHIEYPQVGVMIEVPSAVYQAQSMAQRVDFLSVGSNDLAQYLLAVDRNNARVASLYNALHPAVLLALHHVARSANEEGKAVSICGEMAGDPIIVPLLMAMGFDTLSVSATYLLRAKWVMRNFKMSRAKQMLETVLEMEDPQMIKRYLESALVKAELGGLIRAGKR